jgi:Ca2+-transporting ATPase
VDTSLETGLSEAEAALRLTEAGPNEIGAGGGRSVWRIVVETMREPMFLLLMGAAGLYLVLGDLGEGLFLLGGAAASIGLVIVQLVLRIRSCFTLS